MVEVVLDVLIMSSSDQKWKKKIIKKKRDFFFSVNSWNFPNLTSWRENVGGTIYNNNSNDCCRLLLTVSLIIQCRMIPTSITIPYFKVHVHNTRKHSLQTKLTHLPTVYWYKTQKTIIFLKSDWAISVLPTFVLGELVLNRIGTKVNMMFAV